MAVTFSYINIDKHFSTCLKYRQDAYHISFGTLDGFEHFLDGYKDRMRERMQSHQWFYKHIWQKSTIIGQLEFRSFSREAHCGYVHLMYIAPDYRGTGIADIAQQYITDTLREAGCKTAVLSVSRCNAHALAHYKKHDWQFMAPNPKHALTDFYRKDLTNI